MIAPAKSIVRNTKSGVLKGRKPSVKKAVIEVRAGETIDIYANL
jgi:ribosomal protein L23